MPNKQKLEAEEKVKIVLEYLGGEIGQREGARKAGVTHTTFQGWIRIFENYGIDGFQQKEKQQYSAETKKAAVRAYQKGKANPDAHPLFHSDRGFQYTNRTFHHKLEQAGMTQSMSRVAHCIDNGPMEGFWGILKRERYYGRRFTSKQELIHMIESYIHYYNTRRVQRNLGVLTPMEKHKRYLAA